jgi:hypothetical protein|nr:MAG TPA: hypothetical protein [Caudoviricetes sp.]
MKIMIESDKDITELHIKFAEGSANVNLVKSNSEIQQKPKFVEQKEEIVDAQKSIKSTKKETVTKQAPVLNIPSTEGREVKAVDTMNETF